MVSWHAQHGQQHISSHMASNTRPLTRELDLIHAMTANTRRLVGMVGLKGPIWAEGEACL